MKRSVSLLLAIIMFATSFSFMISASELPFKDVPREQWYYNYVKSAYDSQLIGGYNDGTFKPDSNMKYEEAIKLAACMHQKYTTGSVTLKNGDGKWYETYVDYCKNNGIITKDYPYGEPATRLGYIEIFSKALPDSALEEINIIPNRSILDVASDTEGAESVYKLYKAGIISGSDEKHNCKPDSNIKRSEVATIVTRMMDPTSRVKFDTIATAPIEEVPMEKFDLPEKKQWGDFVFNKADGTKGDKTVDQQRQEILDGMNLAINTKTVWKEVPEFNPTIEQYNYIKAITYDGLEYQGKKTKIFAYVGFPEGASADSPVPAVVLVHGGGGHAYYKWVKIWNDRGYAAIAMETTGYFPSNVNVGETEGKDSRGTWIYGLTEDFAEEGYGNAPNRTTYPTTYTEVQDQWAYHGLSQVILASNILREDERVDSKNIGITGISWGGTMVAQILGYDNRYSFAIPIYGTAYLGDEMRSFSNFADPYVDALWAAERNLENGKNVATLWFAYDDDNNFGVPAYCKSYMHTAGGNPKTTLLMMGNWGHSHSGGWSKEHSYLFADWVTYDQNGLVTFKTQPKGREVNCRIDIPENVTGTITAYVRYIEEPMSYSKHDKFNNGNSYVYLDQKWQPNKRSWLTVDKTTGTISGTIPENVKGYYIYLQYKVNKKVCNTSSVYVAVE